VSCIPVATRDGKSDWRIRSSRLRTIVGNWASRVTTVVAMAAKKISSLALKYLKSLKSNLAVLFCNGLKLAAAIYT
jgi:hypothetical protein